jgi:hypothetical protein
VNEDVRWIGLAPGYGPMIDLCVNDEETSGPITAIISQARVYILIYLSLQPYYSIHMQCL